jgi:hypothetical protein
MHHVIKLLLLLILSISSAAFAADQAFSPEVRYLHVQKGQTLHNILKRLYPQRADEWPAITNEIVRQNPHAFINGDPRRMKADVRLQLPKRSVVRAVPANPPVVKRVGEVDEVNGRVIAVDKRKVSRKLIQGDPVYIGDKVITGEDGHIRLRMVDEALLDLRCFSIMVIEDYVINSANRRSILNLLQGSLRKVTGKIGKMTDDVYELKTPVASVGVRGTEYAVRVFQSRGCGGTIDADDGLYVEVIKGLVDVHNDSGQEEITKGETVYVALPESAPKKETLKPGIISPAPEPVLQPATEPEPEEESTIWWWLLGIVAVVLLI